MKYICNFTQNDGHLHVKTNNVPNM